MSEVANSMPGQKKDQSESVQNEAGGVEGRLGITIEPPRLGTDTALTKSQRGKLWRERNKTKLQQYESARSKRRVEERREYRRSWFEKHPDARKRWNETRKQRAGSASNFGVAERVACWIRQQGECGLCGTGMMATEFDHIVPLCKGGAHALDNVHLVHPECNRFKGRKLLEELSRKEL